MDKELRSLKRWELNCPARIRLRYNNSPKSFECIIKNLNFKGLQAILKKELPKLETPKLTVVFPNEITFTAKVKVIWKKILPESVLYGFSIVEMKDSEKNTIYQLINSNHFLELVKLWWKDVK